MRKTSIGGMALIEGLMMIGPESASIAIRKSNGEIVLNKRPLPRKNALQKLPVVRGVIGFFRQMVLGVKALMYSAEFVEAEEDEDGIHQESSMTERFSGKSRGNKISDKIDDFIERKLGNKIPDILIYITVIVAIGFSIGLFILLPNFLASLLRFDKSSRIGVMYYNLFEGVIRVSLFFIYLSLTSRLKEMRRVWEYHGAEHKTIHCYEHEEELTVENVRKFSTKHPRCGTSYLFLVMIVSIIVFSFVGWHVIWMNILIRLLLVPLIAGISYELLKFAGRCEAKPVKILNAPGLLFQHFTTREPDDSQIEVAIEAFRHAMSKDKDADKW